MVTDYKLNEVKYTTFDDGVELILGADGAPKEGSVNFKKLVRSIAPVASAAD